ncbi:MAG TPA: HTTM domain-containing protein [Polyangiaceae bacterium]|jgi:uncharacterized membrane protein YphA (DoxX/SURF4 family)|nr:HTTM domain-containing protein [Polyangiaceae bacterium]
MIERAPKKKKRKAPASPAPEPARAPLEWFNSELIVRIELVRVFAPLAIIGFMSSRVVHADHWLSDAGFCVPDLGIADPHLSYYIAPLPEGAAWCVAVALVVAGACVSAGFRTRPAAALFAALLAYVAIADRLAAFTVSRLAPVVALAICLSPAGTRFGVDARRARARRGGDAAGDEMSGGYIRFFQTLLVVFYAASGVCKARSDWLKHPAVLWTHLHDSYQTAFAYLLANTLPGFSWTVFQGLTLLFECFAWLWLVPRRMRPIGLTFGVMMHALIGLMFGPVIWFSLLMITLLCASYLPERSLQRFSDWLAEATRS